ncbi:MAG TPA: ATP-dependent RNA helicase [Candidatus Aminicenantes bacterium]|nr:ATP-dependent RNA helicase [Candidatus Aminicenantes bacterium]
MTESVPAGTLPIDAFQDTILQQVDRHPVVILTAETGAGKSTRVPLWLWQRGMRVRVTQPRRIAARSLSHYLAEITGTPWGGAIGFQTGLDRCCSRQTRLLYLTDGVQMQREIQAKRDWDALILDEVHEWNLNQETLMGTVRENLDRGVFRKEKKKVVVMSATLQANRLSNFLKDAPVISVPGRGFPVTMHRHHPEFMLSDAAQLVAGGRNILVFLPGKREIEDFGEQLEAALKEDGLHARILPLHGELGIRDQARVFQHYSQPKVVLATDIAQTSLTIDDIDAVIDSGQKKEIQIRKGIEGLYPVDISRAECLQRAGRAGRVRSGQYILCAEREMDERPHFPEPEIRRLNLESVVLRMINWGVSPRDFPFFHSPKSGLITRALQRLEVYGAITTESAITEDGKHMAGLPVSIQSARMLLEARKSSSRVTDTVLKAIAILEAGGIVNRDFPGTSVHEGRFQSDILNQIIIWNNQRQFRAYIHHKKLSLAKEILRELRSRLKVKAVHDEWSPGEEAAVYRAILSGFTEWVFRRFGDIYSREEEEARRLDRQSILAAEPPEWITGQPFDLLVTRTNPQSGEAEQFQLALITFASRISLELLEDLSPFSYRHERSVRVRNHTAIIRHRVFFGDQLIIEYAAAPDWSQPGDRDAAIPHVLRWIRNQKEELPLNRHRKRLESEFSRLPRNLAPKKKSFNDYWTRFLCREISSRLRTDRLDLFFHFDRFNGRLQLDRLLPAAMIRKLMDARWPEKTVIAGKTVNVEYTKKGARARLPIRNFADAEPEEMFLATGQPLVLDLDGRECLDWKSAVDAYNQWKHAEVFFQRWRLRHRPARMEDIVDLDFPITFEGGKGKKNQALVFFTAPIIGKEEIVLGHFPDKESACRHMDAIREDWNARREAFRSREIERIFQKKGWRVKS